MERLFGKSGLRYNFCRICIGSSDFSLDQYDYLAPGATNLESFSKETILSEWKELIEQFVNPSR